MATAPARQKGHVTRVEPRRRPRWRRWVRRVLWFVFRFLLVVIFLIWFFALRIVEHDSWPPPPDAVTAAQAEQATADFLQRKAVAIEDLAIPLAPSTLSSVNFYSDGPQFFPPMLEDLAAAQSSIHILMFTMTPGVISDRVVAILKDRVAAGVEVRMIVDRYGAKVTSRSKEIFDELADAGVQIVVNDIFPIDRDGSFRDGQIDYLQDEVGNADHRKMIVVDGDIGWIGGAGFEDQFNGGRYHDDYARVTGDVVRQMQLVFLTSFHALGGETPRAGLEPYFPVPDDPGAVRVTLLHNVPGGHVPGTQAIRQVIEHASRRLEILNPYLTDHGMLRRVLDAARRGVTVTVVVPGDSNVPPARDALEHNYGALEDAGVTVLEHKRIMHAKVIVADDTVVIGTINLDAWALYRNNEIALLIEDADVADEAHRALVEDAISRSAPADRADGTWNHLKDWFWDKLVYFL